MGRRLIVLGSVATVAAVVALGWVGVGVGNADSGKTVATRGDEVVHPNVRIASDLRFSPGPATIRTGDTITWTHADKTDAPHTVTLATADALIQSFGDFLGGSCPACDAATEEALAAHFPLGAPPVIDVDDGDGEFDDPGDSVLFFHGESVAKQINAPAGTTLYYFCAIHPWMQGTIDVKG